MKSHRFLKTGRGGRPICIHNRPFRAAQEFYAATASNAGRLRMTKVDPSRRISSFVLSSLSRRVTVSRDEPILCAISSWVKLDRMRISPHALCLSCALQESGHPHLGSAGLGLGARPVLLVRVPMDRH